MKLIKTLVFALLSTASVVQAANLSFTGNFTYDNDVQKFTFVVGQASTVTLRSFGWAGGTNAAGTVISGGGFDPILSLFNQSGSLIDEQDDAGCSLVPVNSGACFDVNKIVALDAGTYTVSIQQFDNFSKGSLAAGYDRDGVQYQNFQNGFAGRTSQWAFDILNVNSAVQNPPSDVPEPASLGLLAAGMAGLSTARRRRNKR